MFVVFTVPISISILVGLSRDCAGLKKLRVCVFFFGPFPCEEEKETHEQNFWKSQDDLPQKKKILLFGFQVPRKGAFSKGGFCRVQGHAQGHIKYPRALAQQCIWHSQRHGQERRASLQKPPSRKPFSRFLILCCDLFAPKLFARRVVNPPALIHQDLQTWGISGFKRG